MELPGLPTSHNVAGRRLVPGHHCSGNETELEVAHTQPVLSRHRSGERSAQSRMRLRESILFLASWLAVALNWRSICRSKGGAEHPEFGLAAGSSREHLTFGYATVDLLFRAPSPPAMVLVPPL